MNPAAHLNDPVDADRLLDEIARDLPLTDFLFLGSSRVTQLLSEIAGSKIGDDPLFLESWDSLEEDQYMADGGRYRKRRHAIFATQQANYRPMLMPHQAHYQSLEYNSLNGGIARHFAPILIDLLNSRTLVALLEMGSRLFSRITGNHRWHIELHQFRIEARDGQTGNPTPEGVHRDGVDFVMVVMIKRVNINSGATTIINLENKLVGEFTLLDTFDMAIVNDHRVYHGVTPISQLDESEEAYRDVLVLTFKARN